MDANIENHFTSLWPSPFSFSFSATLLILGGVVIPDSISGLFGALLSDIRWSKLFLVPKGNILRTLKPINTNPKVKSIKVFIHNPVKITQKLLGVNLGGLPHVQTHGFACPWADLPHYGVLGHQVPLWDLWGCPQLAFPQQSGWQSSWFMNWVAKS